jgi:DNA-binding MltR family transcriptional regulator
MPNEEKVPDPRQRADFEAWADILDAFATESDRAAVVLAVAKLDELLAELLQRVFRPSATAQDELLDIEKPLGTFSAKIHISYRLGLIDASFARALHLVRRIRNSFAH